MNIQIEMSDGMLISLLNSRGIRLLNNGTPASQDQLPIIISKWLYSFAKAQEIVEIGSSKELEIDTREADKWTHFKVKEPPPVEPPLEEPPIEELPGESNP